MELCNEIISQPSLVKIISENSYFLRLNLCQNMTVENAKKMFQFPGHNLLCHLL